MAHEVPPLSDHTILEPGTTALSASCGYSELQIFCKLVSDGNLSYCMSVPNQSHAGAGSSAALVQRHTAGAISALVHYQALLSAQGSTVKPHILLSACSQTLGSSPDGSMGSPWEREADMDHTEATPRRSISGLELVPDLASLGALTERLIFQSGVQEEVQVQRVPCHTPTHGRHATVPTFPR